MTRLFETNFPMLYPSFNFAYNSDIVTILLYNNTLPYTCKTFLVTF